MCAPPRSGTTTPCRPACAGPIGSPRERGGGSSSAAAGLRFAAATTPAIRVELGEGETQAIPPGVDHEVEPLGAVSFVVEFFAVDRGSQSHTGIEGRRVDPREPAEQGGDPACWAGLICPECGAMLDGGEHRAGCPAAEVTR